MTASSSSWSPCGGKPTLRWPRLDYGSVHLWRINVDRPTNEIAACAKLLSADEIDRAARFVFATDRNQFAICRGALRILLAEYLSISPKAVTFRCNEYGRPELARLAPDLPLRFNVSHAGSWGLIALALDQRIGVDIEHVRPLDNVDQVARTFLSPSEFDVFVGLPDAVRQVAFFNGWTRKEAFIKACGVGLAKPLTEFTVSLLPGDPVCVMHRHGDPSESADWTLFAFEPLSDYIAACAVDWSDPNIMYLEMGEMENFTVSSV
jgi:4'-phosphopantetheinyl transferase